MSGTCAMADLVIAEWEWFALMLCYYVNGGPHASIVITQAGQASSPRLSSRQATWADLRNLQIQPTVQGAPGRGEEEARLIGVPPALP